MSDSISTDTYKIQCIAETGYHTWLNFWLNMDMMHTKTNVASYQNTNGKLAEIELPFSEELLKLLVREEFTIVLEHLSCASFEDFEKTTTISPDKVIDPINLIVRAADGSVYLRQYLIGRTALIKLKALFAIPAKYTTWTESTMP
jgi:hypothetical protein